MLEQALLRKRALGDLAGYGANGLMTEQGYFPVGGDYFSVCSSSASRLVTSARL